MNKFFLEILILLLVISGCSPSSGQQDTPSGQENPEWVDQLIDQFRSAPVGNPPQSIRRYEIEGQVVYFVPAQCCDQFSTLYDAGGKVLCAPDGGIDGRGDGKCPNFFEKRTGEELIWEDTRKP